MEGSGEVWVGMEWDVWFWNERRQGRELAFSMQHMRPSLKLTASFFFPKHMVCYWIVEWSLKLLRRKWWSDSGSLDCDAGILDDEMCTEMIFLLLRRSEENWWVFVWKLAAMVAAESSFNLTFELWIRVGRIEFEPLQYQVGSGLLFITHSYSASQSYVELRIQIANWIVIQSWDDFECSLFDS